MTDSLTETLPDGKVVCRCPLGCPWTHTGRAPNYLEIIAVLLSERAAHWILGRLVAKMMRALAAHVAEHMSHPSGVMT